MGKSSAPPAPDYAGAAKETAAGNLANARAQTAANRVDTYTPWGSLTYRNGQQFNDAAYNRAMEQYRTAAATKAAAPKWDNSGGGSGWDGPGSPGYGGPGSPGSSPSTNSSVGSATPSSDDGGPGPSEMPRKDGNNPVAGGADFMGTWDGVSAPTREMFASGDVDKWSSTVELSPEQQALLDQQNKTSLGLGSLQDAATGRVASAMGQPFNTGSLTQRQMMGTVLNPNSLSPVRAMGSVLNPDDLTKVGPMGDVYTDRQSLSRAYDPNAAPKLSGYYNPQQDTNNATQAILSRVAPQLERDKATMDTQLANQGIVRGSEAYNNAQDAFGRRANDAYTQASLQGIDLGMKQQGQNFGQSVQGINTGMAQQGQMFGQTLQNAGFRQGEQAQTFGQQDTNFKNSMAQRAQDAAIQGQVYGQQNQNYGNSVSQRSQDAALQGQTFGQQNTNFNNSTAARQADLEEQAYLRSLPLNELNAIRTGSQVTSPTFSNAPQQQYTPGPDLLSALSQNYGAQMQGVNASNAASAGQTQGLMSIASMAAMAF